MECEMCGSEEKLFKTMVEGTELNVCEKCSKFGNVISETYKPKKKVVKDEPVEMIIPDFAKKIKNARENMNLKQEDLAKKINEKESVIHHVETGTEPNMKLAGKLENFLGIKLIEKEEINYKPEKHDDSAGFTIGDLIKNKKG